MPDVALVHKTQSALINLEASANWDHAALRVRASILQPVLTR